MLGLLAGAVLVAVGIFRASNAKSDDAARFHERKTQAENGDAQAQYELGFHYELGEGVASNMAEAMNWWRKAAEQNHPEAQIHLSDHYFNGKGVATNGVEGVKWLRKAAEQDYGSAQIDLAFRYLNGQGVTKDEVEGAKLLRKAAELNHGTDPTDLPLLYTNGQGVAERGKRLRKAAEQIYGKARMDMVLKFLDDRTEAEAWMSEAEAVVYWVKNLRHSAAWYRALAQWHLAHCYDIGQGVKKDNAEAVKWLRMAAEDQDWRLAQFDLGQHFALGQGVAKDVVEAYAWFTLAAEKDAGVLRSTRNNLEKDMSPQQIVAAMRRANELRMQIDAKLKSSGK